MSVDNSSPEIVEAEQPRSLSDRARRAVLWLSASSFVSSLIRLVSSLILTRLLAPDIYGIVAVAQSLVFGLSMLSDVGLHHSLTRSDRAHDTGYLHAIWTLQVIRGLWIGALVACCGLALFALQRFAPQVLGDAVYAHPDLPGVLCLIALAPVFDGLESIKAALANRSMELGRISAMDLGIQAITMVASVALALVSPTVWVLVGMSVASTALRCVGTYAFLTGPASAWRYDRQVADETWAFGRWILTSSGLAFLATHGDRMLLAAMTTPAMLGQFSIARNLAGMPSGLISRLIGSVGYSALCEIARDRPHELRDAFARTQRRVDLACMTCAGLLAPAGPLIVAVLYDDRYLQAGWMVSVVSVSLVMLRYMLLDQLAMALGDSAWLAWKQAVSVASLFGGVVAGYAIGGMEGTLVGAALSPLGALPLAVARMRRLGVLNGRVEARAWGTYGAALLFSAGADQAVRALALALKHPIP